MDIIQILSKDNYITFNKSFAKSYGIEEALLLGAMCGYQAGFKNKEFYREQDKILEDTALTLYGLRKATKTLQQLGILEVVKKGLPAKHYYHINEENLIKSLSTSGCENDSTGHYENDGTGDLETDTTNKNNNKNNNKNKTKHIYGEFKHIKLTDEELDKLKQQYDNWQDLIDYLDEAIEMKGYVYKSHYLAIKKWVVDAVNKKQGGAKKKDYGNEYDNL